MRRKNKKGEDRITAVVRIKGSPRYSATFRSLKVAKDWSQRLEVSIREGRHFKENESERHTLKDLADRFISELEDNQFRSLREYRIIMRWWANHIGHLKLSEVTPALISEYKGLLIRETTHYKRRRSGARANRYLAVLSSALNTSVREWEWMEDNPARRVKKFREPQGRDRYLSDLERERLLKACEKSKNKDLKLVVLMALSTGARRMEVWGLSWGDVDLESGRIVFNRTKNNEKRGVRLTGQVLDLLRRKRASLRVKSSSLIFPSKSSPEKPCNFRLVFIRALKDAGLEDFRWHDLRHTTGSYLAMQGASASEIASILGHKTLQMVKRYSHISEEHSSAVLERMNSMYFK